MNDKNISKFKAIPRQHKDRQAYITIPRFLINNSYIKVGKEYEFTYKEIIGETPKKENKPKKKKHNVFSEEYLEKKRKGLEIAKKEIEKAKKDS